MAAARARAVIASIHQIPARPNGPATSAASGMRSAL